MATITAGRLLVPPDNILKFLEKTAELVVEKGDAFEQALMKDQKNNPNFDFLQKSSKYNQYYKLILHQKATAYGL